MNQVTIEPFSITTTKVGFGCSSLVGRLSPNEGQMLVQAAYDEGIRHFDVARSYGRGMAESVLGRALGARRSSVTITSKFGLPVAPPGLLDVARNLLRPVAKRISSLRSPARTLSASSIEGTDFSRQNAELSLEATLQQLGTDYLDVLLLHEATAEKFDDSDLLEFLESARKSGKIIGYGIGTQTHNIPALIAECPMFCSIVQHEWSPLIGDVEILPSSFRITHGSLARSFRLLNEAFSQNQSLAESAGAVVGMDVTSGPILAALLLRSAAIKYPDSIALFSCRTPARIRHNTAALRDETLDASCNALGSFIATNRNRLLSE
jgi:aryl-alcohol dehydrogenase-like predicted oxidoreductase